MCVWCLCVCVYVCVWSLLTFVECLSVLFCVDCSAGVGPSSRCYGRVAPVSNADTLLPLPCAIMEGQPTNVAYNQVVFLTLCVCVSVFVSGLCVVSDCSAGVALPPTVVDG